jgi:hypothetical protein
MVENEQTALPFHKTSVRSSMNTLAMSIDIVEIISDVTVYH